MGQVGRVVFLRWCSVFEVGDLDVIIARLARIRRDFGAPLVEVEVVPQGVATPSPAAVVDAVRAIRGLGYLRELHCVVIEGDSMERKLVRGIFSTIGFAIGDEALYCATVEEAVKRACARLGQDEHATLADARAQGLLLDPAAA